MKPFLLILILLAAAVFLTPRDCSRMIFREGTHEAFRQISHPRHR